MPISEGKQLIYAMAGWVGYFLLVYFSCHFLYFKMRGKPPQNPKTLVLHKGSHVPALEVWNDHERRLRRAFIIVGVTLVFLPLVFPILARILL